MVGIFSRFSVYRNGHRRTQSALDQGEVLPPNSEAAEATTVTAAPHGIEIAVEFKPVECPMEPLDTDRPIRCPLPEPSIRNDGRIWKERTSAGVRRRPDLPVMQEETGTPSEPEAMGNEEVKRPPSNRMILPSISAPEHTLLKMLEE